MVVVALIGIACLHGLFVVAEFSLVKSRAIRTTATSEIESPQCLVEFLYQNTEFYLRICAAAKMLLLIVTGIVLKDFALSFVLTTDTLALTALIVLLVSGLQLYFVWELPKEMALSHSAMCLRFLARPLWFSGLVLWPLIWPLDRAVLRGRGVGK